MQDAATSTGTKELILTKASEFYALHGYDAVSMRDLAASVNIKPASLYYHFKNKDDLIREALAFVFAEKSALLIDVLDTDLPPLDRLDAFVDFFTRLFYTDTVFSRLLGRELLDGDDARIEHIVKTIFSEAETLLTQTIREISSDMHPTQLGASIVAMIFGHYQMTRFLVYVENLQDQNPDTDELVHYFTQLARRMLNVPAKK